MPNIVCPNCKLNIAAEKCDGACPDCGWDVRTQIEKTVVHPIAKDAFSLDNETDGYVELDGESSGDFDFGGSDIEGESLDDFGDEAPNPPPSITDTTNSLSVPTLQPPSSELQNDTAPITPRVSVNADDDQDQRFEVLGPTIITPGNAAENVSSTVKLKPPPEPGNPADDEKTTRQELPPSRTNVTVAPLAGERPLTLPLTINSVIPPRSISRQTETGKLQDYQLGKRLGSGSFGVVFRALQVPLDRSVALKILTTGDSATEKQREKIQAEFLREAQFTGKLEHPNIVPVHDIGLTKGRKGGSSRPFYVMKEIHGDSWMDKIRSLSVAENLNILKRVAEGIAFAHSKSVLHCDLKPENVMLGEFGEVLIVDWGQAIDLSLPESIRPGGTPAYIAPEMATYWCDTYLDRVLDSPAKEDIGPRSDVYQLGAILFECVTGDFLRQAIGGETPYDVIRRACQNDMVAHDSFLNDELMKIARRALRVSDSDHIETIDDLLAAIKQFDTRALSIELRERADQLLATAKSERSYDDFQKARFGYEESLEKWNENVLAHRGLGDAKLSCAEHALADENFDLGIDVIATPQTKAEEDVHQRLVDGKRVRDRRKLLVRYLALGLVSSIIVGLGLNAYLFYEYANAKKLRDLAVSEKAEIEDEIPKLITERKEKEAEVDKLAVQLLDEQERFAAEKSSFEVQRKELGQELLEEQQNSQILLVAEKMRSQEALADEKAELKVKLSAEKARLDKELTVEKTKFANQKLELKLKIDSLGSEISSLEESSKILSLKTKVADAVQMIQNGNFRSARKALGLSSAKDTWEWARLNLLTHREVEADFPQDDIVAAAATFDGKRLGLIFNDRVEVRSNNDIGTAEVSIPTANVTAIALSSDGQQLAIGLPARSESQPGKITILDLSNSKRPRTVRSLDAQSISIDHIEFSRDGRRLLSVGKPSSIRKSSSTTTVEELMIWENGKALDIKLSDKHGSEPKFNHASFSPDSTRVLTCNLTGLPRDQFVHIFTESDGGFVWLTQSPVSGLNIAAFADDNSNGVLACARDLSAGTYSLISWAPRRSNQTANNPAPKNLQFASVSNAESPISTLSQISDKALHLIAVDTWLLSCGEDKQTTLWNLKTRKAKSFRGHSKSADFCSMQPSESKDDHVIVSVATGTNSEILKTDLATYLPDTITQAIAQSARDDKPTPKSIFHSQKTKQSAFGNDQGQASVLFEDVNANRQSIFKQGKLIQWEISAWKNHYLTDQFLFAQSRGDYFYRYNRSSGELQSVLIQLANSTRSPAKNSKSEPSQIDSFDVSRNGQLAVITRNGGATEFEIWNLETQKLVHRIDYGRQQIFGTETKKQLLTVRISPDGKWIVGGKLGLFAWSTRTGNRKNINQPLADAARTSLSSIVFIDGTTKFLASWKGRVDVFDLENDGAHRRFNLSQLSYNKNEPNIVDAIIVGQRIRLLVRSTGSAQESAGISLHEFSNSTPLQYFAGAKSASFSRFDPDEVIVVSEQDDRSQLTRFQTSTQSSSLVRIPATLRSGNRFRIIKQAIESSGESLTFQSVTRNPVNPLRQNWNTISVNKDLTNGRLRVLAKPSVDYCAVVGDRAITLASNQLSFWRVNATGLRPDGILENDCQLCQLSPDEKQLAVVTSAGQILFVDPTNRRELAKIPSIQKQSATAICWLNGSDKLAIARSSGIVEIWQIGGSGQGDAQNNTRKIGVLPGPNRAITSLSVAADGQTIMSVHGDRGTARVSRLSNDAWHSFEIQPDGGQQISVGDISADGKRAITGTKSGRLILWNVEFVALEKESDGLTNGDLDKGDKSQSGAQEKMFGADREILNLPDTHHSPITIARFHKNRNGETEIVSAEKNGGENSYVIWKTSPE